MLLFSSVSYAESILQIGDSQSQGIFGKAWHSKIKKETSHKFLIGARGSSSAESWLDYSKLVGNFRVYEDNGVIKSVDRGSMLPLRKLIEKDNPEIIIVQLGGNMVHTSNTSVQNSVKKLLSVVKEYTHNCIWIGPPNGHKRPQPRFGEFYKVLKAQVIEEGCSFIDSRPHTTYPAGQGDGIHFDSLPSSVSKKLVDTWVNGIYKEISPQIN